MTIINQQFPFHVNVAQLITLTDSEMNYDKCFKSTTPTLICMVMNVSLWESETILHELFGSNAIDFIGNRSLGMWGETEVRL